MKKIEFAKGTNIDEAVHELLAARSRGEHVCGELYGHMLYSDTVSIDSSYEEITGYTKEEFDKVVEEELEEFRKESAENMLIEENYRNLVEPLELPNDGVIITMPLVVAGLKFIAENQHLSQEELQKGLLDLGCDFTIDDIKELFPDQISVDILDGMKKGNIACGANVIVNSCNNETGRAYMANIFLSVDNETSIYHFIRVVTGDKYYTKENIDALRNKAQKDGITMPVVVNGLKFIAENQHLSQEELQKGLQELGCTFTFDDIDEQFTESTNLSSGMQKGNIACGAEIIVMACSGELGRKHISNKYLSLDDETSIYNFIRVATGDENYTKENLESVVKQVAEGKITMPVVVEALKFIAENQHLPQEELQKALLELGVDFTFEDFHKQFPNPSKVFDGMHNGYLDAGAAAVLNTMAGGFGRDYVSVSFLSEDNAASVYHYIRKVTGDENYTMDSLNNTTGKKK